MALEARGLAPPIQKCGPAIFKLLPHAGAFGGKGIRTPDIQLAKLALYQLSYAPDQNADSRIRSAECNRSQASFPPVN